MLFWIGIILGGAFANTYSLASSSWWKDGKLECLVSFCVSVLVCLFMLTVHK